MSQIQLFDEGASVYWHMLIMWMASFGAASGGQTAEASEAAATTAGAATAAAAATATRRWQSMRQKTVQGNQDLGQGAQAQAQQLQAQHQLFLQQQKTQQDQMLLMQQWQQHQAMLQQQANHVVNPAPGLAKSPSTGGTTDIFGQPMEVQDAFLQGFVKWTPGAAVAKAEDPSSDETLVQKAKITRVDAKIKALHAIASGGGEEAKAEIFDLQAARQVACGTITSRKAPVERVRILTGALGKYKTALLTAEAPADVCRVALAEAEDKVRTCQHAVEKTSLKLSQVKAVVEPEMAQKLVITPESITLLASLRTSLVGAGASVSWENFPQEQVAALRTVLYQAAAVTSGKNGHACCCSECSNCSKFSHSGCGCCPASGLCYAASEFCFIATRSTGTASTRRGATGHTGHDRAGRAKNTGYTSGCSSRSGPSYRCTTCQGIQERTGVVNGSSGFGWRAISIFLVLVGCAWAGLGTAAATTAGPYARYVPVAAADAAAGLFPVPRTSFTDAKCGSDDANTWTDVPEPRPAERHVPYHDE